MNQVNTLTDSLKAAISERHARMEALPFIAALTADQLPLESYVGQLRAMAVISGLGPAEIRIGFIDESWQNRFAERHGFISKIPHNAWSMQPVWALCSEYIPVFLASSPCQA